MTEKASELQAQIVKMIGKKVWIESDLCGARHVMVQHDLEGETPFCYATFHYEYGHTDNASTRSQAEKLARELGAQGPVEWRNAPMPALQEQKTKLSDEDIDAIANGMPGGLDGFMKGWGWRQFARAIEQANGINP